MYPVSAQFLDAVRRSHITVTKARHTDLISGTNTQLSIIDGSVTDDATANIRRTLNLTLPNEEAAWDALDVPGGEITVHQGIQYADGTVEWVPMGVFIVDQDSIGYAPGGQITMTCPDRWLKVQRNKFGANRASVPSNMAWQEIKRLVEGAWPSSSYPFPGWSQLDGSATTKVGSRVYSDGDREAAILSLCAANSVEVFFDRDGHAVLRKVPYLTDGSAPVWTVDASTTGVLIDATRTRDMSTVRNALSITTSASDIVFAPVIVTNTTPGDPLSVNGPLGYVSEDWSDPSFRNSDQARAAGLTRIRKTLGVAKQLTLEAVGNPALDSEDVIQGLLPQIDRNTPRPTELHILDTVSHPFQPSGTQSIATRSTRPSTDGS